MASFLVSTRSFPYLSLERILVWLVQCRGLFSRSLSFYTWFICFFFFTLVTSGLDVTGASWTLVDRLIFCVKSPRYVCLHPSPFVGFHVKKDIEKLALNTI